MKLENPWDFLILWESLLNYEMGSDKFEEVLKHVSLAHFS